MTNHSCFVLLNTELALSQKQRAEQFKQLIFEQQQLVTMRQQQYAMTQEDLDSIPTGRKQRVAARVKKGGTQALVVPSSSAPIVIDLTDD